MNARRWMLAGPSRNPEPTTDGRTRNGHSLGLRAPISCGESRWFGATGRKEWWRRGAKGIG